MSFAFGTAIESPDGPRAIEDYAVGDRVMAASEDGSSWAWAPREVAFSSGTGPGGGQSEMVYLRFGDGVELVVTPDQPLLVAGGKLQTADRLVPGADSLVAADGRLLPIAQVSLGQFDGGVHAIATAIGGASLDWDGSLDGHLLNAVGAICGDFILQIRQGDPRMARYLAARGPAIGTSAYDEGAG
ncbi:MAG: hypothetical protein QOJ94_2587 [Sphingomonadales bacterium]|jgi:hypothetical protein|nr:hypothetical protein [Sphingomonadales bacterium]